MAAKELSARDIKRAQKVLYAAAFSVLHPLTMYQLDNQLPADVDVAASRQRMREGIARAQEILQEPQ